MSSERHTYVHFTSCVQGDLFQSFMVTTSLASRWINVFCSSLKSSHRSSFVRKGVLRNFAKFTGKHLHQSLFFNKVAGLRPATLLKKDEKETLAQVFCCEFCQISKNTFFTECLWWTASILCWFTIWPPENHEYNLHVWLLFKNFLTFNVLCLLWCLKKCVNMNPFLKLKLSKDGFSMKLIEKRFSSIFAFLSLWRFFISYS